MVSALLAWGAACGLCGDPSTPVSYQGRLLVNGQPANGIYDLRMTLFDTATAGTETRPPLLFDDVIVSNGLFMVEMIFNASDVTSGLRWVEIAIRASSGSRNDRAPAEYTILSPRQKITYCAYSLFSQDSNRLNGYQAGSFMPALTDNWVNTTGDSMTGTLSIDGCSLNLLNLTNTGTAGQTSAVKATASGTGAELINYGGNFIARGNRGVGVSGIASAMAGDCFGVMGVTYSPEGYAAYFLGAEGSRNYFERNVGIGYNAPTAPLFIKSQNKWRHDQDNGWGDFTIGLDNDGTATDYGLCAGIATEGGGAGTVRLWPVKSDRPVIFSNSLAGDVLHVGPERVGIRRIPETNALEVEGNASKSTAGSWLANSDARIKTNIRPIRHALRTLRRVRLVDFEYTKDYLAKHPSIENRRHMNVIAQEFKRTFPDYVKETQETLPGGEKILSVDTHPLTIISAAAIQELNRIVEQKDEEISGQKKRIDALEKRLATLEKLVRK